MAETDLRSYVFLDQMQPQFASFISTVAKGYLPTAFESALFIEIAPGIAINKLTDVALKANAVRPGMQIVERAFGLLEFHAADQGQVLSSGQAVLDEMGLKEEDRYRPVIKSSQIIRNVDDYQAQLVNRMRHGQMMLGGETLYILETLPAAYTVIAANEAEKAANIKLVEVTAFGAFGRLYISGSEADVVAGAEAAERALDSIKGRDPE